MIKLEKENKSETGLIQNLKAEVLIEVILNINKTTFKTEKNLNQNLIYSPALMIINQIILMELDVFLINHLLEMIHSLTSNNACTEAMRVNKQKLQDMNKIQLQCKIIIKM